ncbi:MAG: twin-arginine translocase subunit TatC [Gemmatimonadetes bacterium]|nr:twin-arginine translocase subunit TatC [Gemmatimonadota bacterium]
MPIDQPNTPSEMPFLDHLEELRWRLVKSLAALMVSFFIAFYLAWTYFNPIMGWMVKPILPILENGKLVYTHPMGAFTIIMQLAGMLAIILASPVIVYQVWCFLSPAMNARERKIIVPVLGFALALFLAGVALAVFIFVPVTAAMMTTVKSEWLTSMITAEEYFGFIFFISLAFGAVFELPILVLILTALGLITPQLLQRVRRWAVVISLVVCEIITPGDAIISTLILWVPVYGLYEMSIIVSWFVHRARLKRIAAAESIGAEAAS